MSKKKKDQPPIQSTDQEDIVTMADEATSIIDMGELRRAQAQDLIQKVDRAKKFPVPAGHSINARRWPPPPGR